MAVNVGILSCILPFIEIKKKTFLWDFAWLPMILLKGSQESNIIVHQIID